MTNNISNFNDACSFFFKGNIRKFKDSKQSALFIRGNESTDVVAKIKYNKTSKVNHHISTYSIDLKKNVNKTYTKYFVSYVVDAILSISIDKEKLQKLTKNADSVSVFVVADKNETVGKLSVRDDGLLTLNYTVELLGASAIHKNLNYSTKVKMLITAKSKQELFVKIKESQDNLMFDFLNEIKESVK